MLADETARVREEHEETKKELEEALAKISALEAQIKILEIEIENANKLKAEFERLNSVIKEKDTTIEFERGVS